MNEDLSPRLLIHDGDKWLVLALDEDEVDLTGDGRVFIEGGHIECRPTTLPDGVCDG